MNADTIISELLRQLGFFSLFTIAVALLGKSLIQGWLSRRIAAAVDEGVQRRLASLQLDLDKELEKHRSALAIDFERLRSRLERETTDYGIWATRRHEATATLFAAFLRAETLVTTAEDLSWPDPENATPQSLTEYAESQAAPMSVRENLLALLGEQRTDELGRVLESIAQSAQRSRVIRARNDAYDAYYTAALYLSDPVDQAAREVRDHFHTVIVPYVVGGGALGVEMLRNRNHLRLLMLELQNKARQDLSRSNPPGEPKASLTGHSGSSGAGAL